MSRKKKNSVPAIEPRCIEDGGIGVLVSGREVYPHRPDLHDKPLYRCTCGAYVGCHPGTNVPLGYPAGPETRAARAAVHEAFDPLWMAKAKRSDESRKKAREAGYLWLAGHLGIPRDACHVSHFDKETCLRALSIIAQARAATKAAKLQGS